MGERPVQLSLSWDALRILAGAAWFMMGVSLMLFAALLFLKYEDDRAGFVAPSSAGMVRPVAVDTGGFCRIVFWQLEAR